MQSEYGACCASKRIERVYREAGTARKMDLIIQPTSAEIHVWLTFCEAISEEHLLVTYRELLNDMEKKEESRFYCPRDRHRYLVTRALVRTVLSHYASVDPKDWVFSADAYGRPQIVNPQAADARLSFNVSHTQGLIVLGVAKGRSLGVDVENFATILHLRKSQRFMRCLITSNSIASLNIGLLRNRISKRAAWASLYHSIGSAFSSPMTMLSI